MFTWLCIKPLCLHASLTTWWLVCENRIVHQHLYMFVSDNPPPRAVLSFICLCICKVVWMTCAEEVISQRSVRQREQERRAGKDAVALVCCISRLYYVRAFFPKGGQTNALTFVCVLAPSTILTFCPSAPTLPPVPRIHLYSVGELLTKSSNDVNLTTFFSSLSIAQLLKIVKLL